ncbi:Uncharacterised protein [Mycobacteroides abscessus subsp. bolletii]|nr:Uncharacterised protein [Mycobacteroides abscessus subsp. bolletii]
MTERVGHEVATGGVADRFHPDDFDLGESFQRDPDVLAGLSVIGHRGLG